MQIATIFIYNLTPTGSDQWEFDIYTESATYKYLRIGDYVVDKNNNRFSIVSWATYPSAPTDGSKVVIARINAGDPDPVASTGYDAIIESSLVGEAEPNQAPGINILISAVIPDPTNFLRYSITFSTTDDKHEADFGPGDTVVTLDGKYYYVVEFTGYANPMIVEDRHAYLASPLAGSAILTNPGIYTFPYGESLGISISQNMLNLNFERLENGLSSLVESIPDPDPTYEAGETILSGMPVALSSDGKIYPAQAKDTGNHRFIGFAKYDALTGETTPLDNVKVIVSSYYNFDVEDTGKFVYLGVSTPGSFLLEDELASAELVPGDIVQQIGIVHSTSSLQIEIDSQYYID